VYVFDSARTLRVNIRDPIRNETPMIPPIDFASIADTTRGDYSNRVLTRVNDQEVHISVMHTPYRWHYHPASDETFIGVEGVLIIEFEDGIAELTAGQMLTVPAGTPHCTRPKTPRSVNLTVERQGNETVFCDDATIKRPSRPE
jgi:mannose-6-phosphate isomerase-like protein (cupin superfamily)